MVIAREELGTAGVGKRGIATHARSRPTARSSIADSSAGLAPSAGSIMMPTCSTSR